jgi:hypothetical protein
MAYPGVDLAAARANGTEREAVCTLQELPLPYFPSFSSGVVCPPELYPAYWQQIAQAARFGFSIANDRIAGYDRHANRSPSQAVTSGDSPDPAE